jgi:hypothetical protein
MLADRIHVGITCASIVSIAIAFAAIAPSDIAVARVTAASAAEPVDVPVREVQHVSTPKRRDGVFCRYPVSRMNRTTPSEQ